MKNKISYKLIGLALLVVGMVACDTASQDVSPVISPDGYPVATFTQVKGGTTAVAEGDTILFEVTTDKMIDRAITFNARILEGTANGDDIEITPGVLSPYTTSTTVQVVFLRDWANDDAETIKLEFGAFSIADRYQPNQATVNPVLNLTIANYVSDVLTVEFDWTQNVNVFNIIDVLVNTGTYQTILRDTVTVKKDAAASEDWDFLISPAATFDLADPWASEIGNYSAATGNSPEVMELSGLDDGEYIIWAELYKNSLRTVTAPTTFYGFADSTQVISVNSNFLRQGTSLDLDVAQDPADLPLVYDNGFDGVIAKVVVASGNYTIVNYEGTTSGPWKKASVKTERPTIIK